MAIGRHCSNVLLSLKKRRLLSFGSVYVAFRFLAAIKMYVMYGRKKVYFNKSCTTSPWTRESYKSSCSCLALAVCSNVQELIYLGGLRPHCTQHLQARKVHYFDKKV